jgi:hypothetical protein
LVNYSAFLKYTEHVSQERLTSQAEKNLVHPAHSLATASTSNNNSYLLSP